MAEPVLMEKEGDVTTITLNRPESGNRQTDRVWAQSHSRCSTPQRRDRG